MVSVKIWASLPFVNSKDNDTTGLIVPSAGASFRARGVSYRSVLARIARAHALMESGDHRGKIVLAVKPTHSGRNEASPPNDSEIRHFQY